MISAICFDLDGTLFDDRQYVRAGLERGAEALAEKTGTDLTEELLYAYFQKGVRQNVFDTVLEDAGIPLDFVPELVSAYHDNDVELVPYPRTIDTLEALKEDYQLGVITGGTNGREKLRRLGMKELFEVVIVTPEHEYTKMGTRPFQDAAEEFGCSVREMVYVGDRPQIDFPQPNRLGMHTVRIKRGQYATEIPSEEARPDETICTLEELSKVLERLN